MRLHDLKTSALHLAYELDGPKHGSPVLLLHGWPDSPRTWDGVLPALHGAGYRTVVPYLRGFGPSVFRSSLFGRKRRRSGQPAALAQDAIELADALKLKRFAVVGHDWGARAAYAIAALYPGRLSSLTAISVPFHPGRALPPSMEQAQAFWYQWLLNTSQGEQMLRADPAAFCQAQWDSWSPRGWYTAGQLAEAARAWKNPDFCDVVLQYYRSRWNPAYADPDLQVLETRLEATPALDPPTLLIHGMDDRCTLVETSDGANRFFRGFYRRALVDGVGHFPQREAPAAVAAELLAHLNAHGEQRR